MTSNMSLHDFSLRQFMNAPDPDDKQAWVEWANEFSKWFSTHLNYYSLSLRDWYNPVGRRSTVMSHVPMVYCLALAITAGRVRGPVLNTTDGVRVLNTAATVIPNAFEWTFGTPRNIARVEMNNELRNAQYAILTDATSDLRALFGQYLSHLDLRNPGFVVVIQNYLAHPECPGHMVDPLLQHLRTSERSTGSANQVFLHEVNQSIHKIVLGNPGIPDDVKVMCALDANQLGRVSTQ